MKAGTFYQEDGITILQGDCREIVATLPDQHVHCCVTSPPYWGLRDYGVNRQLGLEPTPEEYCSRMVEVFREVRRVLREDGTLWLNLGDSYCSGDRGTYDRVSDNKGAKGISNTRPRQPDYLKKKDLVGIPWRVAFALQADGWYLRSDIIWHKPNPKPESVTDRPTKAHEYLFLLSRNERYYYDVDAIREQPDIKSPFSGHGAYGGTSWHDHSSDLEKGQMQAKRSHFRSDVSHPLGRNKRTVWTISTEPYPEAHFATFPTALIEPCIKAGCPDGGTVFDPFGGSGTTMQAARSLGCRGLMIELNPDYCRLAAKRLRQAVLPVAQNPAEFRQEPVQETKDLFEENSDV